MIDFSNFCINKDWLLPKNVNLRINLIFVAAFHPKFKANPLVVRFDFHYFDFISQPPSQPIEKKPSAAGSKPKPPPAKAKPLIPTSKPAPSSVAIDELKEELKSLKEMFSQMQSEYK